MLDRMNLFEIYKYPENESLLNKKRFRNKGMRKDNIKIRLMRSFLNNALLNEINEKLKHIDSKIFLKKLPQMFMYNVIKKINKEIKIEKEITNKEIKNEKLDNKEAKKEQLIGNQNKEIENQIKEQKNQNMNYNPNRFDYHRNNYNLDHIKNKPNEDKIKKENEENIKT